ncbi:MAG: sulfate/thiosulfate transport system ATP-binding protein [Gammaproteobacteria bacterium]|jgi:sulfate transport system ATP-binding protein|nr:sulfate/thiosulfate transport system ATP-binding protein [Gammaproteobacteria bacterium]
MSITLRNVSKQFGEFAAVDDVNLDIPSGALLALLGPSGCGKTTLLRIIAGLETPESGHVLFDGRDATLWPIRDRKVGFVFQNYALFRHMSVFENIAFGLKVKARRERPPAAAIRRKVQSLLDLVQLNWAGDRFPAQLSGGQRQRVALARALAVDPEVLLLDEPFGALDAQVRHELRRWLRRLHTELKFTSIFVTHDQQEAIEVADTIVVLNRGRIEQTGVPGEVYDLPRSAYVHRFLGQVNELKVEWRERRAFLGPNDISSDPAVAPPGADLIALIRPHEIDIVGESVGWPASVRDVRVIGPIVRLELCVDGRPAHEPLEAEISRERFDIDRFHVGQRVGVRFRRWQLYPANPNLVSGAAA